MIKKNYNKKKQNIKSKLLKKNIKKKYKNIVEKKII
jgi:hypothetical protein